MSLQFVGQQMINGVTLGGMYALIALGYTLVYGILLMINFAHSEMFMSGAFIGYFSLQFLGKYPFFTRNGPVGLVLLYVISIVIAAVLTGVLGMIIERLAYRPLRHAPRLAPLISAIGVSIFLQQAVLLWITGSQLPYPNYFGKPVEWTLAGVTVNSLQVLIVVVAILLMLALDTFISKTKIGKAMRATSQDREAAGLMGIDINKVIMVTFFIGPALGAIAGNMWGLFYGAIRFDMGFFPGIKSFTAAVIGGIGNIRGAMLGGFLLGILEALSQGFISSGYKDALAFVILIVVLVFRPGGLLGESVVEKV